ncbi:MAG: flagellar biosynthesis anti-sigma factor FlgM [Desulfopila sp.]
MSVDFYGIGGPKTLGNINKANTGKAADKTSEATGTDKVEFSTVLQNLSKSQAVKGTAMSERTERVAALKAQIAEGSYKPDLEKVAASLVEFLKQGK